MKWHECRKGSWVAGAALAVLASSAAVQSARADQINFTGGTVHFNGSATTAVTNNSGYYQNVDYYEESGFRVDFIPSTGISFESIIGDYYGGGNDVIHGHWAAGGLGGLTQIKITKLDGAAFDLNYFELTSNTAVGGGAATGNERAFIHASADGTTDSYSQMLPPENWGWPSKQIVLGSQFDNIKAFWFTVENSVACFGMDSFYINESAPPTAVPLPGAAWGGMALLGTLAGMRGVRRVRRPRA